ncbi:GH25 family lysozyme [Blautia wexlerae]|uniref:GH25 family lysozyme n=1 Tax=Blautia wexlerae TaxID=418240 RepID=UPI0018972B9E|nr:GH25 family lysozyme [Blautia wexlerae]
MEIKGIDVSRWNGVIDWPTVANYGMGFAILRITEKGNVIDSTFEVNYKGCTANNIPVGVYKYSYAANVSEIQYEARKVIEALNGRKLDYPVFLDIEDECQEKLSKSLMMQMIDAFREIIIKAGYKFGIYCGYYWYQYQLPDGAKKYDCWLAAYPSQDDGTMQIRLKPAAGIGWQYSSKATIPGISGKVDRNVFYKDYTATKNENKGEDTVKKTKLQIIHAIIHDAVEFAVNIANDNNHGYSQRIRSLYEIDDPKSFDCSSLACTAYYYAFLKNGLTTQARYLKEHCSYTGNMLNMCNCGFEIVARNQTAHSQMQKGDLELNTTYHVAVAIDKDNIVHARSSEGTTDTKDNSGNEIRTQPWYLYSHGWTHRLRFTGNGIDFTALTTDTDKPAVKPTTPTGGKYMFEPKTVKAGDKNTSVLLLQEILRARGFKGKDKKELDLDRSAGDNTIYALKQYQKSRGLEADGICGTATWNDLIAI